MVGSATLAIVGDFDSMTGGAAAVALAPKGASPSVEAVAIGSGVPGGRSAK